MACCVAAERILTEPPILASVNSKLLEKVGTYLSPVRDTQGHERSWGVSPMRQHCPSTTLSTIGARRSSIRLRTPPPGIRGDEAVAPLWLAINRPAKRSSPIIRPHGLYATTTTAGDRFARNGAGLLAPGRAGLPRAPDPHDPVPRAPSGWQPRRDGSLPRRAHWQRTPEVSTSTWPRQRVGGAFPQLGSRQKGNRGRKLPRCAHFGKRLPIRG
jgi:hypothetical protein